MFLRKVCCGAFASIVIFGCAPLPVHALAVATWNIEYFTVEGKNRYVPEDVEAVAGTIRTSSADVVALQEIEGESALRLLVLKSLSGWKFAGNDTGGVQDLFFLWNPKKVHLLEGPTVYLAGASFRWRGRTIRLFDRPPLVATFLDIASDKRFTLVDVHLKSGSTRGKEDKEDAEAYNEAKRAAQAERINELVATLSGPVFVLGDFNMDPIEGMDFPVLTLDDGFSYDDRESNLDGIGYANVRRGKVWRLSEVEGAIERRSTRKHEHPDHDIVVLDVGKF